MAIIPQELQRLQGRKVLQSEAGLRAAASDSVKMPD